MTALLELILRSLLIGGIAIAVGCLIYNFALLGE